MNAKLPVTALMTVVLSLAACQDSLVDVAPDVHPQFGKAPAAPKLAITFRDGAADKVASDGRSATILGVVTPRSYRDGECAFTAAFSLADVVGDAAQTITRTQRSTCIDGLITPRNWKITLDTPANAGDPVQGVVTGTHFKIDSVQTVTTSALRWSSFEAVSPECDKIRYSGNHGADKALVTRTRTKGVNGSDRDEWTVETEAIVDPLTGEVTGYRDLAICLKFEGNTLVPVRLYHVPFKMTVTQVTY